MQNIQRTNKDNISETLAVADDFSKANIILTMQYPINNVPGNIIEVNKALKSQYFPLKN